MFDLKELEKNLKPVTIYGLFKDSPTQDLSIGYDGFIYNGGLILLNNDFLLSDTIIELLKLPITEDLEIVDRKANNLRVVPDTDDDSHYESTWFFIKEGND